jgi:hypothetical protein
MVLVGLLCVREENQMLKFIVQSINTRLLPALAIAACTASAAQGGIIHPVSAYSDDPILFGSLDNIIDGVVDFDSNVGMGTSNAGTFNGPYTIFFDLGATHNLTGFQLWNNGGNIELDGEGIDEFTLLFYDEVSLIADKSYQAQDILAMQEFVFGFSIDGIRAVELVIESNHAEQLRDYAVLYEVTFVPGPGSLGVLGAFGMVGSRRRR